MMAIQDVMPGKRMRTVPTSEEDVGRADRNPKMMRTRERLYDDEMGDSDYDEPGRSERQSMMERVVLQPVGEEAPPDPIPRFPRRADVVPASPMAELLTTENTDDHDGNAEPMGRSRTEPTKIPEWLPEIRNRPAAVRPSMPAPINLMKGLDPYNTETAMMSVKPEISFPRLLDVSPRLRRELAVLLRSSQPRTRKKKTPAVQIDQVAGPIKVTDEAPDSDVECMYITVWCKGVEIPDVLVDEGAMIDLIAKDVVEPLGLEKHKVHDLGMRLADDSLVPLESYVWLDVNVEGVVARVRPYVIPVTVTYKILLSRRWLKRMKGVEHHATNTLIIQGIDGVQRSTKGLPAPPADLEIVELRNSKRPADNTVHVDDEESANNAVEALLLELDQWELDEEAGNVKHRQ